MSKIALSPSPPVIPDEVYIKAEDHNDELTHAERMLLLQRMDVFGLACAFPQRLSPDQRNFIMDRPPLEEVTQTIQLITEGRFSTVSEVFAEIISGDASFELLQLMFENFRPEDIITVDVQAQRYRNSFIRVTDSAHRLAIKAAMNLVGKQENNLEAARAMMAKWFLPETRAEQKRRAQAVLHAQEAKDNNGDFIRSIVSKGFAQLKAEQDALAIMVEAWKVDIAKMIHEEESDGSSIQ